MMSFRILLAFALGFLPLAEASAGTSTITTKDAAGATKTFVVTTDGSGQFVPQGVICDQAAAAQCATVTAGNALKVDGSAVTQPVSGTVTANAGTGNFTVVNGGTFATQAAQSGTWNITNISGTVSLPTGASTAAKQPALGTAGAPSADVITTQTPAVNTASVASWSTGTSLNTVVTVPGAGLFPANQLTLSATANSTGGVVTFQGTKADGTDETIPVAQILNPNTFAPLTNPYTLTISKQDFLIQTQGYQAIKVKLTTAITTSSGVGTTVISNTNLPYNPVVAALLNPLAPGSAIIGKLGIDQTTPGTTNGVALVGVNGATALAGNGATGAGSGRFTLSNDNTGVANWGHGANAATAPAGSTQAGCRAQNAEATAVTNGQMGGIACDLTLKQIVLPFANPEYFLQGNITSAMTGTTSTAVTGMGAQGSGQRVNVTSCVASNSHATQGTMILLQDGSGGSTIGQFPAASAFGGATVYFSPPVRTTANTALFAQNGTTGANTFLTCTGYKGA